VKVLLFIVSAQTIACTAISVAGLAKNFLKFD